MGVVKKVKRQIETEISGPTREPIKEIPEEGVIYGEEEKGRIRKRSTRTTTKTYKKRS